MSTNMPHGVSGADTAKSAAYTVVVNTDSGKTFYIKDNAVTFTLPAIAVGEVYTFVNLSKDGKFALTISPNASDGINYKGSSTDNKDLINTAATSKKGDFVTIASLSRTDYWEVTACRGIWAKEG